MFFDACHLCDKTFTRAHAEYSYRRHVSYCQRASTTRKGRPKSCTACHTSKVKCSFSRPDCARCQAKGLVCIYEGSPGTRVARQIQPVEAFGEVVSSISPQALHLANNQDRQTWNLCASELDELEHMASDTGFKPSISPLTLHDPWHVNDDAAALAWSKPATDILFQPDRDLTLSSVLDVTAPSSSAQGLLPIFNQVCAEQTATGTVAHLRGVHPSLTHAANLLFQIIRAFPQMMIRRQTFPPFIHPFWNRETVPDKIASCMGIAQLFVTRTTETTAFVWRLVDQELEQLHAEVDVLDPLELQQGMQSVMVFMVMSIADKINKTARRGYLFGEVFQALFTRLNSILATRTSTTLMLTGSVIGSSSDWETWIFEESQRRIACFWFAVSRIFCKSLSCPIAGFGEFQDVPLISPKSLWEARSMEEWQMEQAFYAASNPMRTLGELIQARKGGGNAINAAKLDAWEAGADKLGVLLNIAIEFIS